MSETVIIARGFGGLTFDAIFEEAHTLELEVTDNPVETGVSITDHSYMKPDKVKMQVGVSNHQLHSTGDSYGEGEMRTRNALKALRELMATRESFDVQTGLKLYNNMICTGVQVVQNGESSNALIFNADLREIIIVSTQAVTYPTRKKGKAKNQADKKKEGGEKQGKEVEQPKQKSSLSKKLLKAVGK